MRRKDAWLLGLVGAALAVLLGPVLFRPGLALGNFGDLYSFHYPLQHLALSRLQAGELPFWNPYIFSGLPHLAEPQTALFYPPSALFHVLPLVYAFTLHAAFHLGLAALGTHLWFRSEGLDGAAAATLAAAFALSPLLVYRIPEGIPTQLASLSYVPWCWLALKRGGSGRLALTWALQFLSGHPEYLAINALAMAVLSAPGKWRTLLREGGIAALLCCAQLVPTAEFLLQSNRRNWPAAFSAAYSLSWSALSSLVAPGAGGVPGEAGFTALPSVFFESRDLYAGLVPLALALFGLWSLRKDSLKAWAAAGLGLFFSLGRNNPLYGLVSGFPLIGMTRVPSRFNLLIVWGVLGAAAGGWLAFGRGRRLSPAWKALALAGTLLDVGAWSARFVYAQQPGPFLAPNAAIRRGLAGKPARMATDPGLANPDKTMLYRAMNVNGYSAWYLGRYAPYVARAEGGPAADPSRTYIRNPASPEMARLGVACLLAAGPDGASLRPSPGAWPLSYLDGSSAPLTWEMRSPELWVASGRADADRRLVLAVPAYPGWRAWVNGKGAPIRLHDGLVQDVSIGAGPFVAIFRFQPRAWPALCLACALAWLLLLRRLP